MEERIYKEYKEAMETIKVYAIDKKYLVIILPQSHFRLCYIAHFYNGNKEIRKTEIITGGTSIFDNNGNILNTIDKVEFDGKSIKYYDKCTFNEETGKISYIALNFDGENLTKKVIKEINNITGGGGEINKKDCDL